MDLLTIKVSEGKEMPLTREEKRHSVTYEFTSGDKTYYATVVYDKKVLKELYHLSHDKLKRKLQQTLQQANQDDISRLTGKTLSFSIKDRSWCLNPPVGLTAPVTDAAMRCIKTIAPLQETDQKVSDTARVVISDTSQAIDFQHIINLAPSKEVRTLLKVLITGESPKFKDISWKLIKAILFKKNESMLRESRIVFQEFLVDMQKRLEANPSREQEQLYEFIIGDLLTLYPFLEPHYDKDAELKVPQKVGDSWKLVTYDVSPMQLGEAWMKPPLYAYCLTPKEEKGASSLLLYMGTPPPTTTGAAIAEWVDVIPRHTVGEKLYNMSQKEIEGWIDKEYQKNQLPVKTFGKSLGGAMSLLTSVHCGTKVIANAYNPPGLDKRMYDLYHTNYDNGPQPVMNIFSQKKDPVSEKLGKWPEGANLFRIIPEKKMNFWFSHIVSFFAKKNVQILQVNPEQVNVQSKRTTWTKVYHVVAKIIEGFKRYAVSKAAKRYQVKQMPQAAPSLSDAKLWQKNQKKIDEDPVARAILNIKPELQKGEDKIALLKEYGFDPKKLSCNLQLFSEKVAAAILPKKTPIEKLQLEHKIQARFRELFLEYVLFEADQVPEPTTKFDILFDATTYS